METNKYFNKSNTTAEGRPKFVPPQKRSNEPLPVETKPEPKFEKREEEQKSYKQEERPVFKGGSNAFKRNCTSYTTSWGQRHLRQGFIDKETEKEELQLFEEQRKLAEQKTEGVENYDDLKVEITNKTKVELPNFEEKFENLNLNEHLAENIKRCGYERLTIIQRHAIPLITSHINVMAASQTGSGKTASFLLPIIQNLIEKGPPNPDTKEVDYKKYRRSYPLAIILAPTRELALQIHEEARKFCHKTGILAKVIYGGKEPAIQQRYLQWDGCDILVATTGRLIDFMENYVSFDFVKYVVLDEADRMLDMGFEPQINEILGQVMTQSQNRDDLHVSMFSATFPKVVKGLAEKYLNDYVYINIGSTGKSGSVNKCIKQTLIDVRGDSKNMALFSLIKSLDGKVLVFCGTKRGVDTVYNYLSSKNLFVAQIHGDKNQREREDELALFKSKCSIMIATDVASRGLDIPDVSFVVNYDLPTNIESYIHRIGRTGRIGKQGNAISFLEEADHQMFLKLYNTFKDSEQEIPEWFQKEVDLKLEEQDSRAYRNGKSDNSYYNKRGGGFSRGGGGGNGFKRNYNNNNLNYNNNKYGNGNGNGNGNKNVYDYGDNYGYS